jgi:cysteine-rich repeat protein
VPRFDAWIDGELTLTLGAAASHTIVPFASCGDIWGQCYALTPGAPQRLFVAAGTTYLAVEDGGAGGTFDLHLEFLPYFCGDGVVAGLEQCDDGNAAAGDGCSDCVAEPAFPGCEEALPIVEGTMGVDMSGGASLSSSSCGGLDSAERLLAFTAPSAGHLYLDLGGVEPGVIYARPSCTIAAEAALGCAGSDEVLHVAAAEGEVIYVFVDGAASSYSLTALFSP